MMHITLIAGIAPVTARTRRGGVALATGSFCAFAPTAG